MANRDFFRNNRESRIHLLAGRSRSVSNFRAPQMDNRLREPRLSLGAGIRDLERRTAEVPTILRNNLQNVIDELRPIVERARSSSTDAGNTELPWFAGRAIAAGSRDQIRTESNVPVSSNDVVIDVESGISPSISPTSGNVDVPVVPNNSEISGTANVVIDGNDSNNNNSPGNEEGDDNVELVANDSVVLNTILQYVPFVMLVITKFVFDHIPGILLFISLWLSFYYYNMLLKREVARQTRTWFMTFLFIGNFFLLSAVLSYIIYTNNQNLNLYFGTMPQVYLPTNLSDLLYSVVVGDFILKLITIVIKAMFTLLPQSVIPASKRGKYYLFIESISQAYRQCTPIQPWLYFLLESYQGPKKVIGVFLSAAYMVSKGNLVMSSFKLCWSSFLKVIRNVTIGVTPTKEQISTVGNLCSICHDEFKNPVVLECNHIFCELCVCKWLDREQTCPLCRAKIVDDPSWRDGSTSFFIQVF